MRFSTLLLLFAGLLVAPIFISCVDATDADEGTTEVQETDTSGDEDAVRQLIAQYAAGLNSGSVEAVLGNFSADAIVLGSNRQAAAGTSGILAMYGSLLGSGTNYNIQLKIQDLSISGDMAVAWSMNSGTVQAVDAEEASTLESKSLIVCRKEEDWKIFRYMYNENSGE